MASAQLARLVLLRARASRAVFASQVSILTAERLRATLATPVLLVIVAPPVPLAAPRVLLTRTPLVEELATLALQAIHRPPALRSARPNAQLGVTSAMDRASNARLDPTRLLAPCPAPPARLVLSPTPMALHPARPALRVRALLLDPRAAKLLTARLESTLATVLVLLALVELIADPTLPLARHAPPTRSPPVVPRPALLARLARPAFLVPLSALAPARLANT